MKVKLYLLAALVITFSSCHKDDVNPVQLLQNGDAESGAVFPDMWVFSQGQTANAYGVYWSKEEAYSGVKSLKLSIAAADDTNFAFWVQTVSTNLPIGKTVTLKVKINADLTGDGVSIAIRGDNESPPDGGAEQFISSFGTISITGKFDWKEYTIKLDNVNAATKSLSTFLILNPGSAGAVYFDDISLTY